MALKGALFVGCQQSPKLEHLKFPEIPKLQEDVLVEKGDSSQASYSPDGDRLIFISRGRPGHIENDQIYEKDLKLGVERRITYQNGSTSYPSYHPKLNKIIYSSSTDELKETSPLLRTKEVAPSKLPDDYTRAFELYTHDLKRLTITRLTRHPGFDGEAHFSADGRTVFWTRLKAQTLEVQSMRAEGGQPQREKSISRPAAQFKIAVQGKSTFRAWIEWDEAYGVSRIKLQKNRLKPVELAEDMVVHKTDLRFSPDAKLLLWSQFNTQTKTYQIWSYQVEEKCMRRLTSNTDGHRRFPTLSPDLKWLTYTAERKARSRIVKTPFAAAEGPCVL